MKKLLVALSAVALMITACQKEASHEATNTNPGGGGSQNTKLVRLGARIENDSITLDYTYNAFDRLSTLTASGTVNGDPVQTQVSLNRNAANVITSAVLKSPFLVPLGFESDSIVVKYKYDQTAGRYLSAASHVVVDNQPQADSTIFDYDGSGRLASTTIYFDDGTGYAPDLKIDYEYAGSNVATEKYYSFDNNNLVLELTESYEYDSKSNPLQFGSDAPALSLFSLYGLPFSSMQTYYSANNGTKQTTVDPDIQQPYITTVTYSYNSTNRPTVANGTDGATSSTLTYYYQ